MMLYKLVEITNVLKYGASTFLCVVKIWGNYITEVYELTNWPENLEV